mmetsp:Transcript_43781/g.123933  ORF Transcript_43781/g.123933 Transcript_43781/m.123933 type:complete len:287 (+) Transcript_43781:1109-1969(+)
MLLGQASSALRSALGDVATRRCSTSSYTSQCSWAPRGGTGISGTRSGSSPTLSNNWTQSCHVFALLIPSCRTMRRARGGSPRASRGDTHRLQSSPRPAASSGRWSPEDASATAASKRPWPRSQSTWSATRRRSTTMTSAAVMITDEWHPSADARWGPDPPPPIGRYSLSSTSPAHVQTWCATWEPSPLLVSTARWSGSNAASPHTSGPSRASRKQRATVANLTPAGPPSFCLTTATVTTVPQPISSMSSADHVRQHRPGLHALAPPPSASATDPDPGGNAMCVTFW